MIIFKLASKCADGILESTEWDIFCKLNLSYFKISFFVYEYILRVLLFHTFDVSFKIEGAVLKLAKSTIA